MSTRQHLEIVIPAYNEARIILQTLETLEQHLHSLVDVHWHIIVAENGSTDGTSDLVEKRCLPFVSLLRIKAKGKGVAIRTAGAQSTADILGFIDADLSVDPNCIPALLSRIRDGADIVTGSRLLDTTHVHRGWLRTCSSKLFNSFSAYMLPIDIRDAQCGLKFMNARGRQALTACKEDGWFLDIELLARAKKIGLRIDEVPITWEEFYYPERKSKLRIVRDGVKALRAIWRIKQRLQSLD